MSLHGAFQGSPTSRTQTVTRVRQLHPATYPTCTGSSSTLTCPAISSMSSARWQMDLAWCVHGSGRPLTVMYLSPTVSTCVDKGLRINQSTNKQHFAAHKSLEFIPGSHKILCSCCAPKQIFFFFFVHSSAAQLKINRLTPK